MLSRLQALFLDVDEPHAVISIRDPQSKIPEIPESERCRGVLRLSFHDLERAKDATSELFGAELAREIVDFVERIRGDVDTLVVHCESGVSRSAAVAAALAKTLTGDDRFFFEHYAPNRLVYATMLEALGRRSGGR